MLSEMNNFLHPSRWAFYHFEPKTSFIFQSSMIRIIRPVAIPCSPLPDYTHTVVWCPVSCCTPGSQWKHIPPSFPEMISGWLMSVPKFHSPGLAWRLIQESAAPEVLLGKERLSYLLSQADMKSRTLQPFCHHEVSQPLEEADTSESRTERHKETKSMIMSSRCRVTLVGDLPLHELINLLY